MKYRRLGQSHLEVSGLCLGTMMFGDQTDAAASADIVAAARDRGVNFVDTADVYGNGASERILAPLAYVDGGGVNLTPAQSMYSLTRSWRNVLYAFLLSTGQQNIVAGQRYAERAIA